MVDDELDVSSAEADLFVNMDEDDISVKSVKVLQSANIIDDEINVRNAGDLKFVFTTEYVLPAKNATVHEFANIIKNEIHVKNVTHMGTYRIYVENDEKRY